MELIKNNPYRVAGILSNATERELQKQKTKIKAYTKVGKEIKSEFDFQVIGNIDRTEETVNKAFSTIEQNQDKVNYALFWFLNANPFDNTAIDYLKNGDKKKAIEIWEKVTQNKEVNSKNFSAFNNLGTCKLLSQTEEDIKEGIEAKIKLVESDCFENFVHAVADETFTINNEKQIEKLVNELLTQFKNRYSSNEILQLFSGCNDKIQEYLSKTFIDQPIHNIESQIESTKNRRKEKNIEAYQAGLNLHAKTKDDLSFLKSLLGARNLKYKTVADQLANEIMQCGIDYFKELQDTKDPSREGLKLLKYAKSIATGSQTKERIKDNIDAILEFAKIVPVRTELNFITDKLSSLQYLNTTISNAKNLVVSCKPKLLSMKKKLGASHDLYLNISSSVVSHVQGMLIAEVNEAQEDIGNNLFSNISELSSLMSTISNALDISFVLHKFDMNTELTEHFNRNHKALKSLASQLSISTLSPEEKIKKEIESIQNDISVIKNKKFKENELINAQRRMDEIKGWQLFRSESTKEAEIASQRNIIDDIRELGETLKKNKIRELESLIVKEKEKLKQL
jgi:ribosomal protein S7